MQFTPLQIKEKLLKALDDQNNVRFFTFSKVKTDHHFIPMTDFAQQRCLVRRKWVISKQRSALQFRDMFHTVLQSTYPSGMNMNIISCITSYFSI